MGQTFDLLVIEDSENDAILLLHGLERDGLEPTWERVDNPEAMAEALGRKSWDLIISDHGMPSFSAPAALRILKECGLDVPFIIVSGTIGEDEAVEAMRAGAQDFISKGRSARIAAAVRRELRELAIRRDGARSEETLRETRARLDAATQQLLQAEKLTALGELVAGVAHEINNPLTGVLGLTQLVLRSDMDADARRKLETVCAEAERAARIVKNLLTFARKHPPEKKHLDLNEVIENTLELKRYHFRVNEIETEVDLTKGLPRTMIDGHQMQQVIVNLLNNSEQAIGESGRGGKVKVATRGAGGWIELRVTDTGPGIPSEIQKRIFEPFFTTKREGKGTGLGLSLCYGIIKEHEGQLEVISQPGHGTTFVVRLPVTANLAVSAGETPSVLSAKPLQRSLSFLVVDDEPAIRRLLGDLLLAQGHRVENACDVPEAIQKIESQAYDYLITDMKMPHGTGRDIYEAAVSKDPQLADRTIFTTGDGTNEEMLSFVHRIGNEILLKPYRLEELESAIDRAASRSRPDKVKSFRAGTSQE